MKSTLFLLSLGLFLIPTLTLAAENDVSVVLFNDEGEELTQFYPFGEDYRGKLSISSEDLGNDGVDEIIIGSGPGLVPNVKIYRQDGSLISEFTAYMPSFQNGITVTACDLDGNGEKEIVTGTMQGGGPHVRIFSSTGDVLYGGGFFAYAGDFRGGVNVACGDINNDGIDEIVTGAGITGGPHVKVFNANGNMITEVFSGSALENTGVSVATGDLNGDGDDEIITGRLGGGDPTVIAFDYKKSYLTFMVALHAFDDYTNGIQVSSGDIDGDGVDEIAVSTNKHEQGRIKFFELTGAIVADTQPFGTDSEKGIIATTASNNGSSFLVAASTSASISDQVGKYLYVDVSEQKLYAYENGVLIRESLVSTGLPGYESPRGEFTVTDKIPMKDYVWSYGPDNPNNYNIPNVKNNLRFLPHYYFHYAYWHNNFGNKMSHGCINLDEDTSEWIYEWGEVGTKVEIVN